MRTVHRRAEGGLVATYVVPEAVVDLCVAHPSVIVASDAIPFDSDGKGHPRASGTFCRVLGEYATSPTTY